jgi:hypothetical protein
MDGDTAPVPVPSVAPTVALPTTAEIVQQRRADYNRLVRTARLANLLLEKVDFKIAAEALGIKESLLTRNLHRRPR